MALKVEREKGGTRDKFAFIDEFSAERSPRRRRFGPLDGVKPFAYEIIAHATTRSQTLRTVCYLTTANACVCLCGANENCPLFLFFILFFVLFHLGARRRRTNSI